MTHFAVLTAAAGISDAQADATFGAGWQRLGPMAVECAISGGVQLSAPAQTDLNIVPAHAREKRLLIADMDSTMIPVECIDELADFAGVKEHVSEITERAMAGELDFEAALRERVGLLKGLPVSALEDCYANRIALNPGARVLVRTMAQRGAKTALVSGGFTYFTARVAAEAGFDVNRANTLIIADDVLTGTVGTPILGRQAKLDSLNEFCAEGQFDVNDVIAVGDGANDLAMVEVAGLGVAYKAKATLKAGARAVLDYSDLTALLSLQGISDDNFVRD